MKLDKMMHPAFYVWICLWLSSMRPASASLDSFGGAVATAVEGAKALALSPDGLFLYVSRASAVGGVQVYARDSSSGELTLAQSLADGDGGINGAKFSDSMALSPDGAFLYMTSSVENSVLVFARNALSGSLIYVETLLDDPFLSLLKPVDLDISLDGSRVYVTTEKDDLVTEFVRDGSTGKLTYNNAFLFSNGPSEMIISPNDLQVYVVSFIENTLFVLDRLPASGDLVFTQLFQQGLFGLDGLLGAIAVTVTPNGAYVYTAAIVQNTLAVFPVVGGVLSQTLIVGTPGALQGPWELEPSPDSRWLYVLARESDSLLVYGIEPATGALSLNQTWSEGVGGVSGLRNASKALASLDGRHLYVSSSVDDSVVLFRVLPLPTGSPSPTASPSPTGSPFPTGSPSPTGTPSPGAVSASTLSSSSSSSSDSILPISYSLLLSSSDSLSLHLGENDTELVVILAEEGVLTGKLVIQVPSRSDSSIISVIVSLELQNGEGGQPEGELSLCFWVPESSGKRSDIILVSYEEEESCWQERDSEVEREGRRIRRGVREVLLCGSTEHLTDFGLLLDTGSANLCGSSTNIPIIILYSLTASSVLLAILFALIVLHVPAIKYRIMGGEAIRVDSLRENIIKRRDANKKLSTSDGSSRGSQSSATPLKNVSTLHMGVVV